MFEARLIEGVLLKKLIDSVKDLVGEANLDCSEAGITMQAMDSSHVSLCVLLLRSDAFEMYRCDRNLSLGVSMANISKVMKCADNDDVITLSSQDNAETLSLMFESEAKGRVSDFEMKLMDIDSEHLGIPDEDYKCSVKMPSKEFQRIISHMNIIGDTCTISCSKEGVKFSAEGDIGNGTIMVKQNSGVDKEEEKVEVTMEEPVSLKFALRYLTFFCKATPLSDTVSISMSPDVPVVVEYPVEGTGYVRYYLAPKIDDAES